MIEHVEAISRILEPYNGWFLDIGAYDGVNRSLTYHLTNKWSGVYCEPSPANYKRLTENCKGLFFERAVVPDNYIGDEAEFFNFKDSSVECTFGGSLNISDVYQNALHYNKSTDVLPVTNSELFVTNVKTIRVTDLVNQIPKISFVKIDAEGLSCSIARSWPFQISRPKLFVVEEDCGADIVEMPHFMSTVNYTLKEHIECNMFFTDNA